MTQAPQPLRGTVTQRVFANTAQLTAGRVAAAVLSGVTSILLARYLGSQGFGDFNVIYAYLSFFGWAATLGLENILIREVAKDRDRGDYLFSVGATLSMGLGIAALALAFGGTLVMGFRPQLRWLILLGGCEVLLLLPLQLCRYILRVELRQGLGVLADTVAQTLRLALVAALSWIGASLPWFVVAKLISGLVLTALLLRVSRRFIRLRPRFDATTARMLLGASWPLALTSISGLIHHRIDQLMIFSLLGARQAGLYAATVLIAEAAGHIPAVFMSSTMPLLCQRSSDPARFRSLVQRSFRYLLMAAFPLCLLVTFGARELLGWLYGADFLDAAPALAILIWAEVWVFFGTVMRDTTIAAGFQRHLAAAMFGATLLNVVLNLLLIPTFGIRGAALASLVSYGMHACFAFLLFEETRPFSRLGLRALAAPALISGTLAALLLWIEPPVIFGAVLAAGAYLTLLVAARVLRAEDWTLLLQAIKR